MTEFPDDRPRLLRAVNFARAQEERTRERANLTPDAIFHLLRKRERLYTRECVYIVYTEPMVRDIFTLTIKKNKIYDGSL